MKTKMQFTVFGQDRNLLSTYNKYVEKISDYDISDERSSFIVKSILIGVKPSIYTYKDEIVKGFEVIVALKKFFKNKIVFNGNLYDVVNEKTLKDLPGFIYQKIAEGTITEYVIDRNCDENEIKYFLENI